MHLDIYFKIMKPRYRNLGVGELPIIPPPNTIHIIAVIFDNLFLVCF